MTDYIVDTNHLSCMVTINHPLRRKFFQQMRRGDEFAIAAPILAEFLFGIRSTKRAKQNLAEWYQLRPSFTFYVTDEPDAEKAALLQLAMKRQGHQLKTPDALIAAIALRYDLVLLTTDTDFQRIPELLQENGLA